MIIRMRFNFGSADGRLHFSCCLILEPISLSFIINTDATVYECSVYIVEQFIVFEELLQKLVQVMF
jgi:hypothetical protein